MLKTLIKKPTSSQTQRGEIYDSVGGRTRLMVAKNANLVKSKNSTKTNNKFSNLGFLTLKVKEVFTNLKQAFTRASTLTYFKFDCYIQIEISMSGYTIGGILSQLILEIGNLHPIVYFLKNMTLAKTQYKTHNQKLLAIIEAFKTKTHYLEDCEYKVFV